MYPRISRCLLLATLILCLILVWGAEGQLTYSTGWGKRSQEIQTETSTSRCAHAKPSFDQLLNLYHILQTEAQRIVDCQQPNE